MAECTYTVPDMDASGDDFYKQFWCSETYLDYFSNTYGFSGNMEYWDDGFGWDEPCNATMPLGRTFNACYALTYSAEDWTNDNYDTNNCLQWARRYVRENIELLRSMCGDDSANARSFPSGPKRVELYLPFFYNLVVCERAGTLLHEARHQGGKPHNAKFPAGSTYGEDEDGADTNWDYQGAWMYHALYLWWFWAQGARTTTAMRDRARYRANLIIDNAFATHPVFII